MASTPLEVVLSKLDGVQQAGPGRWKALCPAHDDHDPSLSVSEGDDGRVLLWCWAGCPCDAICSALGLAVRDLFSSKGKGKGRIIAVYSYADALGNLVFQVVRYDPKGFSQRRPDGEGGWIWEIKSLDSQPLYRLVAVIACVEAGNVVWLCEGEKDVERLQEALPEGDVATTKAGGGGRLRDEHLAVLAGATVVLVVDRDDAGRRYVATAAAQLEGVGCSVTVVEPAGDKDDAYDHLEAGFGVSDFVPVDLADLGGGEGDSSGGGGRGSSGDVGAGEGVLGDGHRGTDVGNAERLVIATGGLIRFVPSWRCWIVYDEGAGVWRLDPHDVPVTTPWSEGRPPTPPANTA